MNGQLRQRKGGASFFSDDASMGEKVVWLIVYVGLLVALDQWTKIWIRTHMAVGEIAVWFPMMNLTFVWNTGMSFGLLQNLGSYWLQSITGLIALGFLGAYFASKRFGSRFAILLILSGALGNGIDRVRFGAVEDFLDFHWWNRWHFPTFNLADVWITLGVILLLIYEHGKKKS